MIEFAEFAECGVGALAWGLWRGGFGVDFCWSAAGLLPDLWARNFVLRSTVWGRYVVGSNMSSLEMERGLVWE